MANTLITSSIATYEAARVLLNSLVFTAKINKQIAQRIRGNDTGGNLFIRKPPRFVVKEGRAADPQPIVEEYATLSLTHQYHVDFNWSSFEEATSIEDLRNRILKPAIVPIANKIDAQAMADLYKTVYNVTGTPGTTPTDLQVYLDAGAAMFDGGAPEDDTWCAVLSPLSMARITGGLKGLLNPAQTISDQYTMGKVTDAAGYSWYRSQSVPTHTIGPQGGTPLVDGAGQTGAGLLTKGWTSAAASRLLIGDTFTIAGVYRVHPQNYINTGELQQFVVTANFLSDASGNGTVSIAPSIVTSGAQQTVTASPGADAVITVTGTAGTVTRQNMVFHPDAFALGFVDLPIPRSGNAYRVRDEELGISMRVWEDSDWKEDLHGIRIDVEVGWVDVYAQLAARVAA